MKLFLRNKLKTMKPSNSQTVLFTVFVLVISITVSCKDVLKVTGNYKNPKNETKK